MTDTTRLIEAYFPLKQTSVDSVHEKNIRHGHISTLHIWPARRPLAACRAAIIATLLPDPGSTEKRKEIGEKMAGRNTKVGRKKQLPDGTVEERLVDETIGGLLRWGRETTNRPAIDWFREEIRKAAGGRTPKLLDPFAGGGAIPLEAMRLGCEATALDINPVAWFILKCTLEYPQRLAGQTRRLPEHALADRDFMERFFKEAKELRGPQIRTYLKALGLGEDDSPPLPGIEVDASMLEADLAWHVRAWGRWVLNEARKDLAPLYPVYADFEPVEKEHPFEARAMRLVPLRADGTPDVSTLNVEFEKADSINDRRKAYLDDPTCPRWVPKPAVAYLWARTVRCKNCRATIPLLKTRWLGRTNAQRVLLKMQPNAGKTGVVFEIENDVPKAGGNNAIRREHDRKIGQGTMSQAGAWCPCCGKPGTVAMEMGDIQEEGKNNRLGLQMTAVAVTAHKRKEYRLPTDLEIKLGKRSQEQIARDFEGVPYGVPNERVVEDAKQNTWCVQYGLDTFDKLFAPRQLSALAMVLKKIREVRTKLRETDGNDVWVDAVEHYLSASMMRLLDFANANAHWKLDRMTINHAFVRFAIPMSWDFAEGSLLNTSAGGYAICLEKICVALDTFRKWSMDAPRPTVLCQSALALEGQQFDLVVTDPPYYDAIGYAVIMDFFYVWLRRILGDSSAEHRLVMATPLCPKWDKDKEDGELVDDASRHEGNEDKSKAAYESGMAKVFAKCGGALRPEGRLVIVFANKQPDAWETLVSAIIRAGFVVDGSWPIQTEQSSRMRAQSSAALASSVWLVCKKRLPTAKPGWDTNVMTEMRSHIHEQLRDFWDAGIQGPDFVWAATGPALEAYSKHPIVKKADKPGELMTVSEFLRAVRRIVVEFVVGRVLSEATGAVTDPEAAAGLDDVTTYYLLHRHDFDLGDAPAGACILYAVSCNLSENELADRYDLLVRTGGTEAQEDELAEGGDEDEEVAEGSGSTFKLKPWKQRKRPGMGLDPVADSARWRRLRGENGLFPIEDPDAVKPPGGSRTIPLIDQVHRLMHLWKAGDQVKVDQYLDDRGLRRSPIFQHLLQALIELSPEKSDEKSTLETIMGHVRHRGAAAAKPLALDFATTGDTVPEQE